MVYRLNISLVIQKIKLKYQPYCLLFERNKILGYWLNIYCLYCMGRVPAGLRPSLVPPVLAAAD